MTQDPGGRKLTPRERYEAKLAAQGGAPARAKPAGGGDGAMLADGGGLVRGVLFGIGAAAACAVLWWLIGKFTHREFVFGAVFVGGIVGAAVWAGIGEKNISGGLVAGLLAIFSVIGGKALFVTFELDNLYANYLEEVLEGDAEFQRDQVAFDRALMAAYQKQRDGEEISDAYWWAMENQSDFQADVDRLNTQDLELASWRITLTDEVARSLAEKDGHDIWEIGDKQARDYYETALAETDAVADDQLRERLGTVLATGVNDEFSTATLVQDSFGVIDWVFILAAGVVGFLTVAREGE